MPERFVLELIDWLGDEFFIETGTYRGGTARWAADYFGQVVTIEAFGPRFQKTVASGILGRPNVVPILGDSRTKLGEVLAELIRPRNGPAVIWLDAHWIGDAAMAHEQKNECPLREELAAIADAGRLDHAILIDDARLFNAPPPYPHDPAQWPTRAEINAWALSHEYTVFEREDVLALLPEEVVDVGHMWLRGELG